MKRKDKKKGKKGEKDPVALKVWLRFRALGERQCGLSEWQSAEGN